MRNEADGYFHDRPIYSATFDRIPSFSKVTSSCLIGDLMAVNLSDRILRSVKDLPDKEN